MALDQENIEIFREERADLVRKRIRVELAAGAVAAVVATALSWNAVSRSVLLLWMAASLLIYGVRAALTAAQKRSEAAAPAGWLALFTSGLIVTALLWGGLAYLVTQSGSILIAALVLAVIATLNLFTMTLYAVLIGSVAVFAGITLVVPAAYMLLLADTNYLALGGSICVFAAVLILIALNIRSSSAEHLTMQAEHGQLVSHLDTRREQIEQLRIALKTNTDKREKAESELRRTAADLGLAQGKAKALADTLQRVSPMDPVTGLANRRRFDEALAVEWRRAMREQENVSLILVEIDDYEEYVKTYGAQAADVCLKRTAKIVSDHARRGGDLAARLEDAKFGLVLARAEFRDANRIAEEIRSEIEEMGIAYKGAKNKEIITAHVGMAAMIPGRYSSEKEMVERVDNALYEAKFKGGNALVVFRTLNKMRLERWNPKVDGVLSEGALIQKLMVWGYDATRIAYPARESLPDERKNVDTIKAVVSGQLQLTVEGQSLVLKAGDCLFIPAGTTCSAEVVSEGPVMAFNGESAA
jgi:diguanylate cyclase (GGDEF)-like protein